MNDNNTDNRMKMNIQISDNEMAKATGGVIKHLPYGYICDGTVLSDHSWNGPATGNSFIGCSVKGSDGKTYGCVWKEAAPPKPGMRVTITHVETGDPEGFYQAEPA